MFNPSFFFSLTLSLAPDDGHSVARQSGLSDSHLLLPPDFSFFTRSFSNYLSLFFSVLSQDSNLSYIIEKYKHLSVVLSILLYILFVCVFQVLQISNVL